MTDDDKIRTGDLVDRARKPLAGAQDPETKRVNNDDANRYDGVVERLASHRIEFGLQKSQSQRRQCHLTIEAENNIGTYKDERNEN